MTPEHWRQIERLYHAALELAADERSGFLDEVCAGDPALRQEIESLLAFDGESAHFIDTLRGDVATEMLMRERSRPAVGDKLGCYDIISRLGRGGMGEVYLAQDTNLGRNVALKLLSRQLILERKHLERFKLEARAASALNHPNISTIFEIGHVDEVYFIAMEFIDGETLRQYLENKTMSLQEVLDVAIQAARALEASHGSGIVHRDIKPENIMIRRDGYVKVLDFGLAKLLERQADREDGQAPMAAGMLTSAGIVMGTPNYMSPEQARGHSVDARTDIFSLGLVIYEMVSGEAAFEGDSAMDVIVALLDREPRPLARPEEELPVELQRIVMKALRKEREARYQTITDLLLDLRNLRDELQFEARLDRSASPDSVGAAARAIDNGQTAAFRKTPAPRGRVTTANTASSRKFLDEIRERKLPATLVSAALVVTVGVLAYLYFARVSPVAVNSVAVLPFVNVNNDPKTEYLSDGISESLINSLSRLPQLKVIARSSSFKYRGPDVDFQEVAKQLGVLAIVTGRVVQHGNQLQISAELVDTRDKSQMWGDMYNRNAADLQAVQEEIAHNISEKLRLRLTGAQEIQLTKRATQNPEAYDLYLNGVFYGRKGGNENLKKALGFFNQATTVDPNFALAHANVAAIFSTLAASAVIDANEATGKARAAAEKALEIDPMLAEAHAALALVERDEWNWQRADSRFKQAIQLNPSLAAARSNYANFLSRMGRHTEALTQIKKARELDPLRISFRNNEGRILMWSGRYDEAIQQLENVLELEPTFSEAHINLGYTFDAKEMYDLAITEYQKAIGLEGENTGVLAYLGYAYARSGRRAEALALLDNLKTTKKPVSPAELAVLYVGLGDKGEALQSLERAYAAHDLQMQFLKVDPHYQSLRSDSQFQDLLRRVGLPR